MPGAVFYPWLFFFLKKSTAVSYFTTYKSCPKTVGAMCRKMGVKGRWSGAGGGGQKFVCLAQGGKKKTKTESVLSVHLCNTFEHQELNCCGHGNTSAAEC
jgi:hypothetical protein